MIKSPCIGGCVIFGNGCARCLRTRSEIGEWSGASDDRKVQILKNIDDRKKASGT